MHPTRKRLLAAGALLGALAVLGGPRAGVFDFEAEPLPGQTYTTALFRIHVPDDPPPVRGVYFYLDPCNSDSRYIVEDAQLLGLCADLRFALMGAQLDNVQMGSGIGEGVLRALAAFAGMSGHAELSESALFLDGWSWGGQFAYHFTKWIPARVIGFMTMKGGYHDTTAAGEAILVPGYLFIGELDAPYRIANLTGIFEAHRPLGARWALAMQPGAGHERVVDRGLLDPYVRDVAARRLPAVIEPGVPVELRVLPEPSSWLGDRGTHWIGYFACFEAGRDTASWCPSRVTAIGWQAFVSDSAVTDTVACAPGGVAPGVGGDPTSLRAWPNPSGSITTFVLSPSPGAPVELAIHGVDGRLVRRFAGGGRPVGEETILWDGRDRAGRAVGPGRYYARITLPGGAVVAPIVRLERPGAAPRP